MNKRPLEEKVLRLLRAVERHPELYKPVNNTSDSIARAVKQKTWDRIAKSSGFAKTDDAKCRWRGLLLYFRQIIQDVARKKVRRYIPNTGNPDDKYVQLSDWRYYEYIKFMEPYMKLPTNVRLKTIPDKTAKCTQEINIPAQSRIGASEIVESVTTATAMDTISNHINPRLQNPAPKLLLTSSAPLSAQHEVKIGYAIVDIEINQKTNGTNVPKQIQDGAKEAITIPPQITPAIELNVGSAAMQFDQLSRNDQNLKSFFDAMLRSTQRLPFYHQELIKRKLLNAVNRNNAI